MLARRYGNHPSLIGWQTDNEHGGHRRTTYSYSEAARAAFQTWLMARYATIEALNEAWGNVFWSQTYSDFGEVDLPDAGIEMPNPSHVLDFRRFSSGQVVAFDHMQTALLRQWSPGRFVTHNFMATFPDYDHYAAAHHLDFPSLDMYPTGSMEMSWLTDKTTYARLGHPDLTTLALDLARGFKPGAGFWIMEQQVGQTNWAPWNPLPEPGAVRLWTRVAAAHGAAAVVYFRWRAVPMAQEVLHSGLLLHDGTPDSGYHEVASLAGEVFPAAREQVRTRVVMLHDYESLWAYDAQPHAQDANYWAQFYTFYAALRELGVDVDIRHVDADLGAYTVIVAPALMLLGSNQARRLADFASGGRHIVLGPRSGSRQPNAQAWPGGAPGPLAELAGVRVSRFDSIRPDLHVELLGFSKRHEVRTWAEDVTVTGTNVEVLGMYMNGPLFGRVVASRRPVGCGSLTYLGAWSDTFVRAVSQDALDRAGVPYQPMPAGLRRSRRGSYELTHNWGSEISLSNHHSGVTLRTAETLTTPAPDVLVTEV